MIIAIDYDGTITEDRLLFKEIVLAMKRAGHTPIVCTMRYPHEEDNFLNALPKNGSWEINVYYTSREAKKEYLLREWNIVPDIWIDDNPQWVYTNAR